MQALIDRAFSFAEREAIISEGRTYTYQELLDQSAAVALSLLAGREDLNEERIAFIVPSSFGYVACQWGIWRAGGIAVPLCVAHPLPSLRYVLEDTMATVLIVHSDYEELLRDTAREMDIRMLPLSTIENAENDVASPVLSTVIAPARRAQILYTSGTTSLPKGVVTTHANIAFQIETLVNAWEWKADDRILNILPLHHVHGIINVLSCALWSGACCEFLPKFSADLVWEKMSNGSLTRFMAVPTIYYKLINYWEAQDEGKQVRLSTGTRKLNLMVSGSAALPVPTLERWRTITGQTLLERYGMTEIGMGLSNSFRGERRPGHVGLPLPGVEMRLADEEGETILDEKTPGEIQVKGPSVFLEYWQKITATAEAFTSDGWFQTGDIAELNDGLYRILGRDSVDIIKSGGYKISALEIEAVLLRHDDVAECAVVGIPDQEWGEVIAAAIVSPEPDPDFAAVSAWLKEQIPAYRLPRKWLHLEELPRNILGKVTKNELKKLF
ncbi:MAG: malonyl-CoA/methylmalonyl-CoA synthetase [Neolewinella sp.]|jgi:malonyl-CoA/methylmalonyl-CoA synthetase